MGFNQSEKREGALYLAFGYDYLMMTLNSAISLKNIHPELPISLITNIPIDENHHEYVLSPSLDFDGELFDRIMVVDGETAENRNYKTDLRSYTPYEKTLFLDCDTVVKRGIDPGFNFLDYFDIALAASPTPIGTMAAKWKGDMHVDGVKLEETSRWNSGVLFFNKDGTKELFRIWNDSYQSFGYDKDQYALLHALYTTDTEIMSLDMTWNATDKSMHYAKSIKENIRIYHYSHPPVNDLRNIEEEYGNQLVDLDRAALDRERQEFKVHYSKLDHLRNKLLRRPKTKWAYRKGMGAARVLTSWSSR